MNCWRFTACSLCLIAGFDGRGCEPIPHPALSRGKLSFRRRNAPPLVFWQASSQEAEYSSFCAGATGEERSSGTRSGTVHGTILAHRKQNWTRRHYCFPGCRPTRSSGLATARWYRSSLTLASRALLPTCLAASTDATGVEARTLVRFPPDVLWRLLCLPGSSGRRASRRRAMSVEAWPHRIVPARPFIHLTRTRSLAEVLAAAVDHPVQLARRDGESLVQTFQSANEARAALLEWGAQLVEVATNTAGTNEANIPSSRLG